MTTTTTTAATANNSSSKTSSSKYGLACVHELLTYLSSMISPYENSSSSSGGSAGAGGSGTLGGLVVIFDSILLLKIKNNIYSFLVLLEVLVCPAPALVQLRVTLRMRIVFKLV